MPKKFKPASEQVSMFGAENSEQSQNYGEKPKADKAKAVKKTTTKLELSPLIDDTFNLCVFFKSSFNLTDKRTKAGDKRGAPVRKMIKFEYDGGIIEAYHYSFPFPKPAVVRMLKEIVSKHGAEIAKHHCSQIDMRLLTKYVIDFT